MWMVKIERAGEPMRGRQHYECQVCGARTLLPLAGE